jgi:acyl carrier protein
MSSQIQGIDNNIREPIRQFIRENFLKESRRSLLDGDPLLGQNMIKSLGLIKLVTFIETEFEIILDDEDIVPQNFQTIASIVDLIDRKLKSD